MKKLFPAAIFLMTAMSMGSATQAASAPGTSTVPVATDASSAKAGQQGVTIDNFSFSPATVTVAAGTTVVWTNHDDIPHNIVDRNQKFKSKALDTDDTFSYTFTEPGTYEYFCGLHPKMVGKIVVTAKP